VNGESELKQDMDCDGYVVLHNLFSKAQIEILEGHLDPFLDERRKATGSRSTVQFAQKLAEKLPAVFDFAKSEPLVKLATTLLGPNVDLYFNQAIYKYPEDRKSFSWHQDDAYGPVEPSPYLTVWIALSDAYEENGCLSVLPGSHRDGLREHVDSDFGLSGYSLDAEDQGVLVPVAKGGAVAMWSTMLHKSGANRSNSVRKGLVLQYAAPGLKHLASGMIVVSKLPVARQN
jgi:phytanoyl-CoA hydroxylase